MLHQNCLVSVASVTGRDAADVIRDIELKRWKRTCMLLVAFIMEYVFQGFLTRLIKRTEP